MPLTNSIKSNIEKKKESCINKPFQMRGKDAETQRDTLITMQQNLWVKDAIAFKMPIMQQSL